MVAGFKKRGIPCTVTDSRKRVGDTAILLGTTLWQDIEKDGEYLLVDCPHYGSFDHWSSLSWNGRGGRAEWHDRRDPSRWEKYNVPLLPWQTGARVVLCGQIGTYSPEWQTETDWYKTVPATHFRPHPAGSNYNRLPLATDWTDCGVAVVLNSSIAIKAIMDGVPVVTQDCGSMAWSITGHTLDDIRTPEREEWCHWLAWCQWSHDEIQEGMVWDYLW